MVRKKVLIFGASGQIGRKIIRKATLDNHKVTAVTRNIHQKGYFLKPLGNPGYIDVVESSIFDEDKIRSLVKNYKLKAFIEYFLAFLLLITAILIVIQK